MQDDIKLLVFTDLDGTLLNSDDYRYDAALPVLARLQENHIPVIPVTSKTRAEVEELRRSLHLDDPFIVENGSGVFIAQDDARFTSKSGDRPALDVWENYQLLRFGCTYAQAREGMQAIATALEQHLTGFGDLTPADIANLTGLSLDDAQRAKAREFTEPFITPKTIPADRLADVVHRHGFQVVVGDRFSHLIGQHAGKGRAVQQLIALYQFTFPEVQLVTIGLGNSPNDRDMLETVDLPIVIPGQRGPHPGLRDRGWQVAPAPGAQGWADVVARLCDRYL